MIFIILKRIISKIETKIIKIKYSESNGVVDNCGHPMMYHNVVSHPNIGDTYEIILQTNKGSEFIISMKPVEKEKYVENCSAFI